jgi:hypothetical protein
LVGAASHTPLVQLEEQQLAPPVQAPPVVAHGVTQVRVVASQCFEQQSALAEQAAFWPRHAPGGKMQRPSGPHRSFLSVAPQHPD